MRVLLVEDEPRAAQMLAKGLREQSYAVDIALNGRDALYQVAITDYLVKPFDFGELMARLRAVIRRGRLPVTPAVVTVGDLRVDLRARQAYRHNQLIKLTAREFTLLEFLVLHAGEVVRRGAIAEHVWDSPFESMSNVIDVMIQRLRRKINDDLHRPQALLLTGGLPSVRSQPLNHR